MTIEALTPHLSPSHRDDALAFPAQVAALLEAMVAHARTTWPDIEVDLASFVAFLAERLDTSLTLPEALDQARGPDLWIACACGAGTRSAITAFERIYFSEIGVAVRRSSSARLGEEDVAQLVRERLFVARPGMKPKILEYSGRGSLRGWLRVATARLVLNLATRGPREQPADDEWFARVITSEDGAELAHLKAKYRGEFRTALEAAIGALVPKDRNVLRYSFGDGLSIDAIGGIYGVHRATAARWIAQAQTELVAQTRTMLMNRLGATPAEVDSIVHMIASRFDVTLAGLLDAKKDEPEARR